MYLRPLKNAAQITLLFSALSLVGGLITGFVVAMTKEESSGSIYQSDEYPNVGAGIAIGFGGLMTGALLALLGYWALAWAAANEKPVPRQLPPPARTRS